MIYRIECLNASDQVIETNTIVRLNGYNATQRLFTIVPYDDSEMTYTIGRAAETILLNQSGGVLIAI